MKSSNLLNKHFNEDKIYILNAIDNMFLARYLFMCTHMCILWVYVCPCLCTSIYTSQKKNQLCSKSAQPSSTSGLLYCIYICMLSISSIVFKSAIHQIYLEVELMEQHGYNIVSTWLIITRYWMKHHTHNKVVQPCKISVTLGVHSMSGSTSVTNNSFYLISP